MQILKSRKFAVLAAVLVAVAATLLSGHAGLQRLRTTATDAFYNGTEGDGLGIYNDLGQRTEYAFTILRVASGYLPASDADLKAMQAAREELVQLLPTEQFGRMAEANGRLSETTEVLYDKLLAQNLSELDLKTVKRQYSDFISRNATISHDGFSALADEFNRARSGFPARFIATLTGVSKLEPYR